ncbi:24189_t:CDS:2, partial [Dentiscutata erythropus]
FFPTTPIQQPQDEPPTSVLRPMLWSIKEEERLVFTRISVWICTTPNAVEYQGRRAFGL